MDDEELTAWHEAGHATMVILCGGTLERVTVEPPYDDGPNRYGDTVSRWRGFSRKRLLESEIRVSLAGPVAETIYLGEQTNFATKEEWSADWETATKAAAELSSNPLSARKLVSKFVDEIQAIFESDNMWAAVSAVADELMAHETLEHESVSEIVGFWTRR